MIEIFETIVKQQKAGYFKGVEQIKKKYSFLSNEKIRFEMINQDIQKENKRFGFDLQAVEKQLREYTSKFKTRPFFPWQLYFAEVFMEKGGFDIIITNPPYIGEKGNKETFRELKRANLGKYYFGKMDMFYFFFHLAFDLGNKNAQVAFITTNYYPTATGAVKLRKDFKNRTIIRKLVNFNELKIFESALGQHNMITIAQKGQNTNAIANNCITSQIGTTSPELLTKIINRQDNKTQYFEVAQKDIYDGDTFLIRLPGLSAENLDPTQTTLEKLKVGSISLGLICNINTGIQTGADKVSKKHLIKYKVKARIGEGIFVLNEIEVRNLNLTSDEKQILKPWFKNSDVFRWRTTSESPEYVIYFDRKKVKINKLISYLEKYKDILKKRREVENGVIDWWQLQWPRDNEIFNSPKTIAPQRSKKNTFGFNEDSWYASADVYFITTQNTDYSLKYVLALLNSPLYYLWLYHRGKRKGEALELYQSPLSEVPIKKVTYQEQKQFIEIVDKILALTRTDDYYKNIENQALTNKYEKEINNLVYKLYDLSKEEIEVVEGSVIYD